MTPDNEPGFNPEQFRDDSGDVTDHTVGSTQLRQLIEEGQAMAVLGFCSVGLERTADPNSQHFYTFWRAEAAHKLGDRDLTLHDGEKIIAMEVKRETYGMASLYNLAIVDTMVHDRRPLEALFYLRKAAEYRKLYDTPDKSREPESAREQLDPQLHGWSLKELRDVIAVLQEAEEYDLLQAECLARLAEGPSAEEAIMLHTALTWECLQREKVQQAIPHLRATWQLAVLLDDYETAAIKCTHEASIRLRDLGEDVSGLIDEIDRLRMRYTEQEDYDSTLGEEIELGIRMLKSGQAPL